MPQLRAPSSSFSPSAVLSSSAAHSTSLSRPKTELANHRLSPSIRRPSEPCSPTPPSYLRSRHTSSSAEPDLVMAFPFSFLTPRPTCRSSVSGACPNLNVCFHNPIAFRMILLLLSVLPLGMASRNIWASAQDLEERSTPFLLWGPSCGDSAVMAEPATPISDKCRMPTGTSSLSSTCGAFGFRLPVSRLKPCFSSRKVRLCLDHSWALFLLVCVWTISSTSDIFQSFHFCINRVRTSKFEEGRMSDTPGLITSGAIMLRLLVTAHDCIFLLVLSRP